MKVVLHIGAHRTGTTTFQRFMRTSGEDLTRAGIGFWGPYRTRNGLFAGMSPSPGPAVWDTTAERLQGRLKLHLAKSQSQGVDTLVISDENLIGSVRSTLKARRLYPAIGERMARLSTALDGKIDRVVLTIRSLDLWWQSAASYGIMRGATPVSRSDCVAIARNLRGWRDVIMDVSCALPEAEISVLPFEYHSGAPEALLSLATGYHSGVTNVAERHNTSPSIAHLRGVLTERGASADALPMSGDRWQPFTEEERSALRELYADDLFWLQAGADGLATLAEDPRPGKTDRGIARGHTPDVTRKRQVAQPRRG